MRERFAGLSNNLYLRPDVHIFVEDGRSFVRRSTDKYQVLQATLVDTWAATAAGAFALSENNLYTSDAFRDYLLHLTDDGTDRYHAMGLRSAARIAAADLAGDRRVGADRRKRGVAARDRFARRARREGYGALDTVLISRKPFTRGGYRARSRDLRGGCPAADLLSGQRTAAISFGICC